ncbi:unnamed protein product [Aspergillus oryzae RIB40]|uniref:DNA, SC023 n=1 Tax=Aspergillus oryzae (strain ATCC 42149 / RIB 40) TaxID=510516 RepID=Q2UGQ1_ASPOR|nr:unnamed protein product [Aspergillus oryzae RIB40]BAE59264.1 unnamed protein product [Aspergillus oryzae RIB40]
MVELQSIFKKAYWSLAAGGLVYVQPFNLVTPDNETLYAWHLLPPHLCREHEEKLNADEPSGPASDYTKTPAYELLANDPNARVVVAFHGNAAHIGSAQRPETYRMLLGLSTPSNPIHVFAMDYRGFGISTGSPTEEGLITDGVALLNFLTSSPLNIPPSRIVITGQSLGTAVSAAVTERFAFGSPDPTAIQPAIKNPEPFAGVILIASFSNIPSLLDTYSLKGLTPPILSPLVGYPRVKNWTKSHVIDRWDTAARVARLTGVGPTAQNDSAIGYADKGLDLTIVHAYNDAEIPWYEGRRVWVAATGENDKDAPGRLVHEKKDSKSQNEVLIWENRSSKNAGVVKSVRWERVPYGGHNRVATFSVAALAVLRAFEQ